MIQPPDPDHAPLDWLDLLLGLGMALGAARLSWALFAYLVQSWLS